jgi:hypothetical protein
MIFPEIIGRPRQEVWQPHPADAITPAIIFHFPQKGIAGPAKDPADLAGAFYLLFVFVIKTYFVFIYLSSTDRAPAILVKENIVAELREFRLFELLDHL